MTKRKKILHALLILSGLAAVIGYGGSQLLKSKTFRRATGPIRCQIFKKHHAKQPGSKVVYQKRPEQTNIQTSWELDWFGRRIPIPKGDYSEVIITRDKQKYLVILQGQHKNQRSYITLLRTLEPQEVFTGSQLEADLVETPEEGQALMEKSFGEPISETKLTELGYRHTPKDLSCTYKNLDKDLAISLLLILKEARSNVTAAYEMEQGFITFSSVGLWVAQWDDGAFVSAAHMLLPEPHKQGELGLGIGQTNWQAASDPPEWLTTLATALKSPTPDHWQALAVELKQAGMSEKSLEAIQKLVDES